MEGDLMTKTLNERIAALELEKRFAQDACEEDSIIRDLQAENQALLAKNGELQENYDIILETHNHFLNKPIYAHCEKLEAKVKELEGKGWLPIESAPKDASFLAVVNVGLRKSVHILRRCFEGEYGFDYGMFLSPDGGHYGKNTVSHWMPLPPKPTNLEE